MALNVTTAVFGENCNTATASPSLAQWDKGQVLQISGVDLPDAYQVEFSTVYTRNAIPVIGNASGVQVPNELLQRSAPITACVVLHSTANSRDTEYWVTIHITPRKPPETITPDPEQQDVIDQAIAALQDGTARAEAAATAAAGSATEADGNAENAEAWAVGQRAGEDVPDTDPTYRNNAKYYAGAAEAAAEEAGQHEASWESWVRRAETAADDAEGSARVAAGSKADAEAAAQTATQKATEAGNSAAAASGSASEARQTVDGAIGAINTAKEGALTAIGSAGSNAVGAVNQEGTTQTERVTTEGNTQVNRVQEKGDEVIGSIPQDYTDLVDDVADLSRQLNDVKSALNFPDEGVIEVSPSQIIQGSYNSSGAVVSSNTRIRTIGFIPVYNGEKIRFASGTNITQVFYGRFRPNKTFINDGVWLSGGIIDINWDGYIILVWRKSSNNENITPSDYDAQTQFATNTYIETEAGITENSRNIDDLSKIVSKNIPVLQNGSLANIGNANGICTQYIFPIIKQYNNILLEFVGDFSKADNFAFNYVLFKNAMDGMTSQQAYADNTITKMKVNVDEATTTNNPFIVINIADIEEYDHIAFGIWVKKNGEWVQLRILTDQYSLKFTYQIDAGTDGESGVYKKLLNARHIPNESSTPFTIAHFSDCHSDTTAVNRILNDIAKLDVPINDIICTGDMVANTATPIVSWWPKNVLTCIGNHDAASYSSGSGYDWDALSMADRDTYYIAPFETEWGITHTSGKSYYYKDYSTEKVRLIVLDAQVYIANGQEATEQTTWLTGLLSSAVTNNLHVMIAIHAQYGGSPVVDCSFSKYGRENMLNLSDSFTPLEVVNAVSSAIANGLKFIGYIVGHNHQDYVYRPATGQIGFCVTCAAVTSKAQWMGSDQYRGSGFDAYNIVTVDTANTLVKIVRGGGADIDDHMRTRKAICFNYATGEKVGEVL